MAARKKQRTKSKSRSDSKSQPPLPAAILASMPEYLPVMPMADMVAFPSVMMSMYVMDELAVRALEDSVASHKLVFVSYQRSAAPSSPHHVTLSAVGVVANVVRTLRLPDARYKVLIQGLLRGRAVKFREQGRVVKAKIELLSPPDNLVVSAKDQAIMSQIKQNVQVLVDHEHLPEEMLLVVQEIDDPGALSDVILAHYKLELPYAQSCLEELDPLKRLRLTDTIVRDDLNQFVISENIRDRARDELSKGQKEYFLREQIKQIQRELGEQDGSSEDLSQLKKSLESLVLSPEVREEADKQFRRLERMHPESSEYALLRTYLEWIAELPWSTSTNDRLDLKTARTILDEDHYGLEKAKERILEFLSVKKLNPESKGPILCFVGPPGVGKTSLGFSIARALNRKFFRMSLGGMRDEAEIRGHRRTYVGALPGRIIQGIKQVKSRNPLFVLDELDKVGTDFRGDPASALLEVLDPAQNKAFRDHYLNVDFDLSDVLFIATANTVDTIPDALLDRLEVITIPGYTTEEKVHISRRFLFPRQLAEHGLGKRKVKIDDAALLFLIEHYTREAGVRNLEREIGSLCRKLARAQAEHKKLPERITPDLVRKLLGITKFDSEAREQSDLVGLVHGLAWTTVGGEVMPIEASVAPGSGKLTLTGQLGSVMQESAQAALFYARANVEKLGLSPDFQDKLDIHVHVPAGATPKDGPSAGITMATALISALSNRRVARDVAMTGEITLRGNVLAVGGLREKALAALRHGIKKIVIPKDNLKDVEEVPEEQRRKIRFLPVTHIAEVLDIALLPASRSLRMSKVKVSGIKPVVTR